MTCGPTRHCVRPSKCWILNRTRSSQQPAGLPDLQVLLMIKVSAARTRGNDGDGGRLSFVGAARSGREVEDNVSAAAAMRQRQVGGGTLCELQDGCSLYKSAVCKSNTCRSGLRCIISPQKHTAWRPHRSCSGSDRGGSLGPCHRDSLPGGDGGVSPGRWLSWRVLCEWVTWLPSMKSLPQSKSLASCWLVACRLIPVDWQQARTRAARSTTRCH